MIYTVNIRGYQLYDDDEDELVDTPMGTFYDKDIARKYAERLARRTPADKHIMITEEAFDDYETKKNRLKHMPILSQPCKIYEEKR